MTLSSKPQELQMFYTYIHNEVEFLFNLSVEAIVEPEFYLLQYSKFPKQWWHHGNNIAHVIILSSKIESGLCNVQQCYTIIEYD